MITLLTLIRYLDRDNNLVIFIVLVRIAYLESYLPIYRIKDGVGLFCTLTSVVTFLQHEHFVCICVTRCVVSVYTKRLGHMLYIATWQFGPISVTGCDASRLANIKPPLNEQSLSMYVFFSLG